jgi:integrase
VTGWVAIFVPVFFDEANSMTKKINRLSAVKVAGTKTRGMYADGGGLYLQVSGNDSRSWIFRFKANGRTRDMGLGSLATVSLAKARELAAGCRQRRLKGIDPIEARRAELVEAQLASARAMTFDQCRDAFIDAHKSAWRNAKHKAQWTSSLATYASPVFGSLPIQSVDVALVMKALEPIWGSKPETASRVRGRVERVLDWAKVRGFRQGENPARWRGYLDALLPARGKVRQVRHHAALPYDEIGAFMAELRKREGIAARALEFTILTAARTGEVLGARWEEMNIQDKVWVVPPSRMKAAREHRVPLSRAAVAVLKQMQGLRHADLVFPGNRRGKPLSNMSMLMMLRRMGRSDLTAHGFRSTLRDWAAERTNFPREVAEAALAHVVGDKVEAAYRRGDLFEKRRRLMDAWATYCLTKVGASSAVVALKPAKAP